MQPKSLIAVAILLVLASGACGGTPETGERGTFEGTLVEQPRAWPGRALGLRSEDQFLFLFDREIRPDGPLRPGDLPGLGPGDEVRVKGRFSEFSTLMRSTVEVERIERRD